MLGWLHHFRKRWCSTPGSKKLTSPDGEGLVDVNFDPMRAVEASVSASYLAAFPPPAEKPETPPAHHVVVRGVPNGALDEELLGSSAALACAWVGT